MKDFIRIIGKDFELVERESCDKLSPKFAGLIDHNDQTITIKGGLTRCDRFEVILHEIIHAISEATEADLSEKQTRILGRGLFAVMRENPEMIKSLMASVQPAEKSVSPDRLLKK